MSKPETLGEKMVRIQETYSVQPGEAYHAKYWRETRGFIAGQILQACNQWLEKQGAQHKVKCSYCSWSQFTSEVAGMSQCYECNSTGYIFEPLRLEIDA